MQRLPGDQSGLAFRLLRVQLRLHLLDLSQLSVQLLPVHSVLGFEPLLHLVDLDVDLFVERIHLPHLLGELLPAFRQPFGQSRRIRQLLRRVFSIVLRTRAGSGI